MQNVRVNTSRLFLVIVISLFVLGVAAYIIAFGENVPYWDEWDVSYGIATKTATQQLTLYDLFQLHNSHRIVFTNLLTVFSTINWNWNLRSEMFVSLALAGGCFVIVAALVKKESWLLVGAAALLFSLRQEWLWSFMTQLHFALLFIMLTIWCLTRQTTLRSVVLACITAVCATYSFGYGVTIWPLGIALLAMQPLPRRYLVFWCFMAALNVALFALTYRSTEVMTFNLIDITTFVLAYLGSPFVLSPKEFLPLALIFGGLGIVGVAINVRVLITTGQVPVLWLILVAYAASIGALIAIGRISLGIDAALAGRYTIIGNLFWIGGLLLAQSVLKQKKKHKVVLFNIAVLSILIGSYLWSVQLQWAIGNKHLLACVGNNSTACEETLYPDNERVIEALPVLERLQLSFFADE